MPRSRSVKRLAASSTAATLDRAGREPGDEVALQEDERGHHRHQADEAGRGDELPLGFVGALQAEDAERNGEARLRIEQHQRERELRPVGREVEDRRRRQAGRDERQRDRPQRAQPRRAVEPRRLEERRRHGVEEVLQHPDGERHLNGGVRQHQAGVRVDQTEPLDQRVERQQQHDRREHLHGQQHAEQRRRARQSARATGCKPAGMPAASVSSVASSRDLDAVPEIPRHLRAGQREHVVGERRIGRESTAADRRRRRRDP